ncbi:hypothetical protein B0O99DRAFT_684481 [Bisporella sp. PMI_857]|nr:hypothetical protein B0O99DRAFT_684481 [Bisporella sp. PMI_857]
MERSSLVAHHARQYQWRPQANQPPPSTPGSFNPAPYKPAHFESIPFTLRSNTPAIFVPVDLVWNRASSSGYPMRIIQRESNMSPRTEIGLQPHDAPPSMYTKIPPTPPTSMVKQDYIRQQPLSQSTSSTHQHFGVQAAQPYAQYNLMNQQLNIQPRPSGQWPLVKLQ